jgi:NAD(P)-dependent dehydrogenase (short-subunit alcohol dehydrogenase family)
VAVRADVTEPGDVAAMVDATERRWGRVDVLSIRQAPNVKPLRKTAKKFAVGTRSAKGL